MWIWSRRLQTLLALFPDSGRSETSRVADDLPPTRHMQSSLKSRALKVLELFLMKLSSPVTFPNQRKPAGWVEATSAPNLPGEFSGLTVEKRSATVIFTTVGPPDCGPLEGACQRVKHYKLHVSSWMFHKQNSRSWEASESCQLKASLSDLMFGELFPLKVKLWLSVLFLRCRTTWSWRGLHCRRKLPSSSEILCDLQLSSCLQTFYHHAASDHIKAPRRADRPAVIWPQRLSCFSFSVSQAQVHLKSVIWQKAKQAPC